MIDGLTIVADRTPFKQEYWNLWQLFAKSIQSSEFLARLDRRYSPGSELISSIFLTKTWKKNVRHWEGLEGFAGKVDQLFENLLASPTVLENYVRFLYEIGEQSLPLAFIRITNKLKTGDSTLMLQKANTVFMLETLLRRNVYARPFELKSNKQLRQAILNLLDILVESGSSAEYRMRDDFATPIPV